MNTTNTKITLLIPDQPNNFKIRNITLKISKDRNNKYGIQPIYIQGILYPKKENVQITTTIISTVTHANCNHH